ncbi:MAG: DUF1015 domain-containing protein [Gracilimonas sp.]|uniref:DUF1015 domain-containing protein n=1 Tax=Gracilimonas TaxID=649462 RepID=UPI001B244A15|nr:DUF1015 family protein [Gracilimonas sp.]MBO6585302.1 DUF1015 domain-containing protein [Gracilimonas sp.]MBO6616298.1 DUF1015 domain-containing protein [Gracilimonas sp.]
MAVIKPFKACRPHPEFAEEVACVPYDVINTSEAKQLAKGKPNSFLNVIRPEIDLPAKTSVYDAKVYEKGRENLHSLLQSDAFIQEDKHALYIYRLIMNGRSQTGIFGCVSVDDYNNDVILKHELTRPDKEDDRTKHILTQQAHAEPVMLTFRDTGSVTHFMDNHMDRNDPVYDLTTEDGIQHTIWKVEASDTLVSEFQKIARLYVADGHHRCASAARAAKEQASQNPAHDGSEEYNFFPAVLFPMDQMEILAYNRIVFSIPDNFLKQLEEKFTVQKKAKPVPAKKGMVSFYVNDNWYGITLKPSENTDPASNLDISLLQNQVLTPILNVKDQRTDPNIDFVGGIRGTDELENLVDNGEASLGISLYPTSIEELLDVSDAGQLMPPKSTWFEPKLRSGLLVHTF